MGKKMGLAALRSLKKSAFQGVVKIRKIEVCKK